MVYMYAMDNEDERNFTVPDELDGQRFDKVLTALCPEFSRSRLKTLIDNGDVSIDGKTCTLPSLKICAGQVISLTVPEPVEAEPQPEDIPLNIVY